MADKKIAAGEEEQEQSELAGAVGSGKPPAAVKNRGEGLGNSSPETLERESEGSTSPTY